MSIRLRDDRTNRGPSRAPPSRAPPPVAVGTPVGAPAGVTAPSTLPPLMGLRLSDVPPPPATGVDGEFNDELAEQLTTEIDERGLQERAAAIDGARARHVTATLRTVINGEAVGNKTRRQIQTALRDKVGAAAEAASSTDMQREPDWYKKRAIGNVVDETLEAERGKRLLVVKDSVGLQGYAAQPGRHNAAAVPESPMSMAVDELADGLRLLEPAEVSALEQRMPRDGGEAADWFEELYAQAMTAYRLTSANVDDMFQRANAKSHWIRTFERTYIQNMANQTKASSIGENYGDVASTPAERAENQFNAAVVFVERIRLVEHDYVRSVAASIREFVFAEVDMFVDNLAKQTLMEVRLNEPNFRQQAYAQLADLAMQLKDGVYPQGGAILDKDKMQQVADRLQVTGPVEGGLLDFLTAAREIARTFLENYQAVVELNVMVAQEAQPSDANAEAVRQSIHLRSFQDYFRTTHDEMDARMEDAETRLVQAYEAYAQEKPKLDKWTKKRLECEAALESLREAKERAATERYGGIEARRRIAFGRAVRRAAYHREPDAAARDLALQDSKTIATFNDTADEVELAKRSVAIAAGGQVASAEQREAARKALDELPGYGPSSPPDPDRYAGSEGLTHEEAQRQSKMGYNWKGWVWYGRVPRERDKETHALTGTPRQLDVDCAYEMLRWYFGGDAEMEVLPTMPDVRRALFDRMGIEFLDEAFAKGKKLPGITWPQYKDADYPDEQPKRKELRELSNADQKTIRNLGMRRFCHGTDTLILCTADSVPITTDSQHNVLPTNQRQRTPADAEGYRSNEHKLSSAKLTAIALRYMKCMCAAGQHNELFVTTEGNNARESGTAAFRSVADVAFDLLGQTTPRTTSVATDGASEYVTPFCWAQTILLSKVFALVEQLALDIAESPGHSESGTSLKTHRDKVFLGGSVPDNPEGPTRTYEARSVQVLEHERVFKFPTPDEFDNACSVRPYQPVASYKDGANRGCVYGEDNGSGAVTVDDSAANLQAKRWSVAMEIETNPHAAAAWCVMLHRLLSLQGVQIGAELTASSMKFLWSDTAQVKAHFQEARANRSAAGSSGAPTPTADAQIEASIKLLERAGKDNDDLLPPNELATWILAHPAVHNFVKRSRFGEYMLKVFETAQDAWFVRQSRILELAVHWGQLQLSVPDAQVDLTPTAVSDVCYWHSALHRVMIPGLGSGETGPYAHSEGADQGEDELSATRVHINGAQFYRAILMGEAKKRRSMSIDYAQVWRKISFMSYQLLTAVNHAHHVYGSTVVNLGTLVWGKMNAPAKMALSTILLGGLKLAAPKTYSAGQGVAQAMVGHMSDAFTTGANEMAHGVVYAANDFARAVNELLLNQFPNVNARLGIVGNIEMLQSFLRNPLDSLDGFVDHVQKTARGTLDGKDPPPGQPDLRLKWFGNAEIALQGLMHTYVKAGYTTDEVLPLVITLKEFSAGRPPGVLTQAQRDTLRARYASQSDASAVRPVMFVVINAETVPPDTVPLDTCPVNRFAQPDMCAAEDDPWQDEVFRWYDVATVRASIDYRSRRDAAAYGTKVKMEALVQSVQTGQFLTDRMFKGLEKLEKIRQQNPSQLLNEAAEAFGLAAGQGANSFLLASAFGSMAGLKGFMGLGGGDGDGSSSWWQWISGRDTASEAADATVEANFAAFAKRALEMENFPMAEDVRELLIRRRDGHTKMHAQTTGAWFTKDSAFKAAAAVGTYTSAQNLVTALATAARAFGGFKPRNADLAGDMPDPVLADPFL